MNEYEKKLGEDGFIYVNQDLLKKQKGIVGYFLKSIGSSLLKGNMVMNLSLPINIFDFRSLLEMFVHQHANTDLLERAAFQKDSIERIKLVN